MHNTHKGLLEGVDYVRIKGRLVRPNIHIGRTIPTAHMRPRYYVTFTNLNNYLESLFQGADSVRIYATYHVYSSGNGLLVYRSIRDHGLRVQMCRQ